MTLKEEMIFNLCDLGLFKTEAQECMHHVIQVAEEQHYFPEHLYGKENCWEWDISKFTPGHRLFEIFHKFVLDEAFKWLTNRFHALKQEH